MGIREVKQAVFLDRDGTLNLLVPRPDGSWASPRSLDEFILVDGAAKQVERIKSSGFLTILATNQPDVARGFLDPQVLEAMHRHLMEQVPVDHIMVCTHEDADDCPCRKPRPGMLSQAAEQWGIDLTGSFMVGDSWKDMEAARAAGVKDILINAPYNQEVACSIRAESLESACDYILAQGR
jgi:D-glycero-D-manno-heptose 1,7-bisphosphate phosphatase